MQEVNAQAEMVPTADLRGGLATTISRTEVEEALRAEEPPELILDVSRGEETRSVAVSWKREDLERLLREATSDQIQLTFDRSTIEEAMDADVEAHGFREKALVLAVAFAAAAGTAGAASGMPLDTPGGGGSAVHLVGGAGGGSAVEPGGAGGGATVEPGGAGGGATAQSEAGGPSGVHLGDTTAGAPTVLTGLSGPSGVHLGDTTAGGGDVLTGLSGPSGVHLGDTTAGAPTPVTGLSGPSGVHLGDTTGAASDAADLSGPSGVHLGDTTAGGSPAPPSGSGSGDEGFLSDPGAGTAAVGGAIALAITGAAFAFGAKRRLKPST